MSYDSWKLTDSEGEAAAAAWEIENRAREEAAHVKALYKMTRPQLVVLEGELLTKNGMRRVYGGPGRKDEFINSILELERCLAATAELERDPMHMVFPS